MSDHVQIFDTTLRDGEQSPGISLNIKEKLEIAEQLARLNVDVIEAGFPITSPVDFEAVSEIAKKIKGPIVAALARTHNADIDRAYEAVKQAQRPRIHVFVSTSPTHLKHQLKKTEDEVLEMARLGVSRARKYVEDVEFSAMDATRSDPEYLYKIFKIAVDEGATVINIPDTVGYTLPGEYQKLIKGVMDNVSGIENVIVSVHCHNDLGLAVANSLAAIEVGARQVECAVNGIGERAGNASLEEIAMILDTRYDRTGVKTQIKTEEISRTSRLVSMLTGYSVQPNKAIVGENAFSHESGIHQDGVLKERSTYEIMSPAKVGVEGRDGIVMGKHSGRHAFKSKLTELGYDLDSQHLERAFIQFKSLVDRKEVVTTRDLEALAINEIGLVPDMFVLEHIQSSGGTGVIPIAAVRLAYEKKMIERTARGDGQVDAVCRAIRKATGFSGKMVSYRVNAVTGGIDAQGEVAIKLELDQRQASGRAIGTDVVEASARAYLNAINKLLRQKSQ